MLKNKKVVIFDLDGTLIDSIGIWNQIDQELIKRITHGFIEKGNIAKQRDTILKQYSQSKDAYLEYCGFLKENYHAKMTKQEIKDLRYQIADNYLETVIDYKPKAEEVIHYLQDKGMILAIASTTNDHTIEIYKLKNQNIRKKANLEENFKLIYAKGAVQNLKPNPDIHFKIMNELQVKPEECLIIEDSLIGVEAANQANIDVAVMYDCYSDSDRNEINRLSHYQFNDFSEMLEQIKKEK